VLINVCSANNTKFSVFGVDAKSVQTDNILGCRTRGVPLITYKTKVIEPLAMNNLALLLTGPLVPRMRSEVPEFLQNGSLYKTHLDEAFPIMGPLLCMKFTRDINDNESCISMLCTLRYWSVKNLPRELMSYVLSKDLDWDDYDVKDFLLEALTSARLLFELKELPENMRWRKENLA